MTADASSSHPPTPKYLYKYLSRQATVAVLKFQKLKWSSPLTFNDPFDSQWNIAHSATGSSFDRFIAPAYKELLTKAIDWKKLTDPKKRKSISELRTRLFREPHLAEEIVNERRAYFLKEGHDLLFERLTPRLRQLRLLCLSENPRSLLMWSHYSENHRGAILQIDLAHLKFKKLHRVVYATDFPEVISGTEWRDLILYSIKPPSASKYVELLISTKSNDWSYEQEWRLSYLETSPSRAASEFDFVTCPPHAISSIVFGCRSDCAFENAVLEWRSRHFPNATIQRAKQSRTGFAIEIF